MENVAGYFFMATRFMYLSHVRVSATGRLKFEPIEQPVQASVEHAIPTREADLRRKKNGRSIKTITGTPEGNHEASVLRKP